MMAPLDPRLREGGCRRGELPPPWWWRVPLLMVLLVFMMGATPRPSGVWLQEDWDALTETSRWALTQGLDTVPLGDAMAAIGRSLVGTPYEPHTLEVEGPERVVINLRVLDCVTFVENVFALARFVRQPDVEELLGDRAAAENRYEGFIRQLRYRDGVVDGYPSRLHYFSDWIRDNARRGLVRELSPELGAVPDPEPVDFMSSHPDAYRQLANPEFLQAIRAAEVDLNLAPRHFIPVDAIEGAAEGIRDGDIIAATSTVAGLDVAHTGLALWVDGELHLLHAPLVGSHVEVSEVPLAQRIAGISGQDGIMVARPVER